MSFKKTGLLNKSFSYLKRTVLVIDENNIIRYIDFVPGGGLPDIAKALKDLGSIKSWVVHGSDGMDQITLTGNSMVAELNKNHINEFEIIPEKYGFKTCSINDLQGGTPKENAAKILALFKGEKGPYRDIVLLNAAAGFCVTECAKNFEEGISIAKSIIDNGKAINTLNNLIKTSNQ